MYQDHQQYSSTPNSYLTHAGPSTSASSMNPDSGNSLIPLDTANQPSLAHTSPLVATGDWTKDLVHLAKTAELKYVPGNCAFGCPLFYILCVPWEPMGRLGHDYATHSTNKSAVVDPHYSRQILLIEPSISIATANGKKN
jgi:hypothetical protein